MADDHAAVRSLRWIEKLATRWADGVITVSEPCRRILGQRGLDTGKVTVLPHTVAYRGPAGPAGGTGDAPHLITHATLIKRHGVQVAIRAMRALAPRCPGLSLRVIGDGEYRRYLEALTSELGLQDRVQFTGKLTWDETMAHFALCHARGRKLRCGRRQAQRPPIASLRWPDVADREYLAAIGLAPPPGAPDPAPSSESVV
jgi:glycosyltransferase involved in cell wall biosynthesis